MVGSVLRGGGGCWGVGFAEVFEEEDYAVDGAVFIFFFFSSLACLTLVQLRVNRVRGGRGTSTIESCPHLMR